MHAVGWTTDGDTAPLSDPLGWSLGLANHSRSLNWTAAMLDFFRSHPLKPRR